MTAPPDQDPAAAAGDDRIGPYCLHERIGAGRLARVFRATGPSGEVALKLLSAHAELDDPAAQARFAREIEALARIDHPGVVALLDHGLDPELGPYLVTPLVAGRTLRALIDLGPVEPAVAVTAATALAEALGAVHAAGLIHRDVKPENLIVRPDGGLVLLDLGLAWGEAHTRYTEEGAIAGSVPYMAPEQIEGRALSPATDVWAVGILLHEWITGRRPFARARQSEEVAAILAGRHEPLARRDARVPAALDELVTRCLAADPAARPADGAALARTLRATGLAAPGCLAEPHVASARLGGERAAAAIQEAQARLADGDGFGAARLLRRALAHTPGDPRALALIERIGREPLERIGREPLDHIGREPLDPGGTSRRRRGFLAPAILLGAIAVAAGLIALTHVRRPAPTDAARPVLPSTARDTAAGLLAAARARLSRRDVTPASAPPAVEPTDSEAVVSPSDLARFVAEPFETVFPHGSYDGNPYDLVMDRTLTAERRAADPALATRYARAQLATFQEEQAIAELDRTIRDHPRAFDALMLRAFIERRRGRLRRAEQLYTRAIVVADADTAADAAARAQRGLVRRLLGALEGASEDLRRAVRHRPRDVAALRALAATHLQAGRAAEGEPLLARAVKLAPDDAEAWAERGLARGARGDRATAHAVELAPRNAFVRRARCLVLAAHDRPGVAEACRQANIHDRNEDAAVHLAAAESLLRTGHLDDASTFTSGLRVRFPDDPRGPALEAAILERKGLPDLAARYRRVACSLGDRASCRPAPN